MSRFSGPRERERALTSRAGLVLVILVILPLTL